MDETCCSLRQLKQAFTIGILLFSLTLIFNANPDDVNSSFHPETFLKVLWSPQSIKFYLTKSLAMHHLHQSPPPSLQNGGRLAHWTIPEKIQTGGGLNPWKFQIKQNSTPGNSTKLC